MSNEDVYTVCINAILRSSVDVIGYVAKREIRKLQLHHEKELAEKERELQSLREISVWQGMRLQSSSLSTSATCPYSSSAAVDPLPSKYPNTLKKKSGGGSNHDPADKSSENNGIHEKFAPIALALTNSRATKRGRSVNKTKERDLLRSSPTLSVSSTSTTSTAIEELDPVYFATTTAKNTKHPNKIQKKGKNKNDNQLSGKQADLSPRIQKQTPGDATDLKRKADQTLVPTSLTNKDIQSHQENKQTKKKLKIIKYEIDGFTYKVGDKYLIGTVQDLNEKGFNNVYKIRCFIKCSDDPDSMYVEIQEPTHAFSLIYVRNLHWLHEQDKIRPCK